MRMKPLAGEATRGQEMANALKQWVMAVLTFIFVALYSAALGGLLKPLADEKVVTRLEPIIFVIIGYYFDRLPGQQNERTLKDEITRQTQKADAAQHAKEQAQQSREALEEKVKNARSIIEAARGPTERVDRAAEGTLRTSLDAALTVLNS